MRPRSWTIIALLVLAAVVGAVAMRQTLQHEYMKWRMDLRTVPLAGTDVVYRDKGEGAPTVVIVTGVAVPMEGYYDLQTRLSVKARVITYDRPGIGESGTNSDPRTLEVIDRDLLALLGKLDAPPPYVLIGHSWGGHIIRKFAALHPEQVAGLVFLDQPHEDWFRYIRSTWSKEEADAYFLFWTDTNPAYSGAGQEEVLAYEANCDRIRGVAIPPDIPVLMFTTSNYGHFRKSPEGLEEDRRNWLAQQTSLLTGVKDQRHLVDMSLSHWFHQEKADWVVSEIGAFIDKVRPLNPVSPVPAVATTGSAASSP